VLPSLAARLLARPPAWAASVGVLLVAWLLLMRRREREARGAALVFDDAAHPRLTLLRLERPAAVVRHAQRNLG
jgi:hypothetical protein